MSTGAPQGGRVDGLAPDCSLGEPVLGVTGLSPWVSDVEEIFMQESDALNFLKKCSKRSPRFQDEVNGKTLWPAFCSCSFSLPVSWAARMAGDGGLNPGLRVSK